MRLLCLIGLHRWSCYRIDLPGFHSHCLHCSRRKVERFGSPVQTSVLPPGVD